MKQTIRLTPENQSYHQTPKAPNPQDILVPSNNRQLVLENYRNQTLNLQSVKLMWTKKKQTAKARKTKEKHTKNKGLKNTKL